MADETPAIEPTRTPPPPPSQDDSIINRKIERRGLPSSFSSNLGRSRVSPPRNGAAAASSGKSVKSIVNFFETSKSNTASAVSVDGESSRSKPISGSASRAASTTATSACHAPLVQQQQSIANAPDVEEYSLTLLKYRQYFTNQPLGRCLDGKNQDSQVNTTQDDQKLHVPKKRRTPTRDPKTKSLSADKDTSADENQLIHRDPQEVAAFWNHIRNYLWISDEELEAASRTNHQSSATPRSAFVEPDIPSPTDSVSSPLQPPGTLRGDHRADSYSSEYSVKKARRRLASTEKQIFEIDAYVSQKSFDNEVFPSSPVSTIASPIASPTLATNGAKLRAFSSGFQEPHRCTSCSKIRVSHGELAHRGSGHSADIRPPPRAPVIFSCENARHFDEPPVLHEADEEWNFF